MFTNLTLLTLIITLGVFVAVIYFELQKINKQVLEIQEQIHFLTNEINKLDKKLNPQKQTKDPIKKLIKG
jgi:prefoldin subunit 5